MIAAIKLLWSFAPSWLGDLVTGLIWALAVIAVGLGLIKVGHYQGRQELLLEQRQGDLKKLTDMHAEYVAEIERGNGQVRALLAARDLLVNERDELQRRLAHVPQTVPTSRCPEPGAVHLTLGAVRLWNADLGYPGLPAGACGADGTAAGVEAPDGVCSADSGIGIFEARDNVRSNFRACTAIRAQCQALIDNLNRRAQRLSTSTIGEQP